MSGVRGRHCFPWERLRASISVVRGQSLLSNKSSFLQETLDVTRQPFNQKSAKPDEKLMLTLDSTVLHSEELGLVITRDCGVRVHVAREHGQRLGQVIDLHCFFAFLLI